MKLKILAASAALIAAAALAGCGDRDRRDSDDGLQAVTPSDAAMSEAVAASEAPSAADAASDAAAVVTPEPAPDLSADDIAATGNTSRRTESAADVVPASQ